MRSLFVRRHRWRRVPVDGKNGHRCGMLSLIALLIVSLSACQSINPSESLVSTELSQAEIAQLTRQHEMLIASRNEFVASGGLGIWTDDESISARIVWQQTADALQLTLEGPLGLGTVQLANTAGVARLTRGDKVLARGSRVDDVLQQGLGLQAPVPLGQLAHWIRGLPGEGTNLKRDEQGKLSSLMFTDEQGWHWQARFRRYADWDGAQVPSLITASGGPYTVRLLLKDWQYVTTTVVPETPESNNRLSIPGR